MERVQVSFLGEKRSGRACRRGGCCEIQDHSRWGFHAFDRTVASLSVEGIFMRGGERGRFKPRVEFWGPSARNFFGFCFKWRITSN